MKLVTASLHYQRRRARLLARSLARFPCSQRSLASLGVPLIFGPLIAYSGAAFLTRFSARRAHNASTPIRSTRRTARDAFPEKSWRGLLHARITCRHVGTRVTRVIKIFSLHRRNAAYPASSLPIKS